MACEVDLDYLNLLLNRYKVLDENTKEWINTRNAITELLIPVVKAILLTYKQPLCFDMFQDAVLDQINQINKWNPSKTKRKKNGDAGDLSFFIRCTHNFCRNYLTKQNRRNQREVLVNIPEYLDSINLTSKEDWMLPAEVYLNNTKTLENKDLQKPYEECLDILLGNGVNHSKIGSLKKELREKYKLTYENVKTILILAEETIREFIKEEVING